MADIIDIDVFQTVTSVSFEVEPNTNIININKVTIEGTGGGGGGATDLAYIATPTNGTITSSTGSGATIPLADGTNAGLLTSAEKTKIANSVPYTGATSDVNLGEFGIQLGNLEFDNTPTNIPTNAGSVYYNDTDGTLDLILKGGNVTLQVGQETVIRVVNKTSTNISLLESNYQAVRITGAQGQRPKVDLAQATNDVLSAETIGLVTETINNNQEGFITTSGLVRGINTTGSLQGETWLDGDILYLSPTIAGNITKVKPTAPNHLIIIGYVISAHITQGTIFVKVDNGYELDELHNVKIATPANNSVLAYTLATDIWENKTVETALGYTPYNATNPSDYQTASQVQTIADAKVVQTITNGVTTTAPSQDAVFDALALKQDVITLTTTGTSGASTLIGATLNIPQYSGATNLGYTPSPTNGIVTSSTGTSATLPLADATNAGLLKPAKFTVLENTSGINTGDQDLSNLVVKNAAIIAATNTKITYDAKGLVTAGTSLIATDIPTITQAQVTNLTTDLAAKAPLASPAFTGTPTATTATPLNNSLRIATTAYVEAACAVVASSGGVSVSSQDTFGTANIATVTAAQYAAFVAAGTVSATTLYFITA